MIFAVDNGTLHSYLSRMWRITSTNLCSISLNLDKADNPEGRLSGTYPDRLLLTWHKLDVSTIKRKGSRSWVARNPRASYYARTILHLLTSAEYQVNPWLLVTEFINKTPNFRYIKARPNRGFWTHLVVYILRSKVYHLHNSWFPLSYNQPYAYSSSHFIVPSRVLSHSLFRQCFSTKQFWWQFSRLMLILGDTRYSMRGTARFHPLNHSFTFLIPICCHWFNCIVLFYNVFHIISFPVETIKISTISSQIHHWYWLVGPLCSHPYFVPPVKYETNYLGTDSLFSWGLPLVIALIRPSSYLQFTK